MEDIKKRYFEFEFNQFKKEIDSANQISKDTDTLLSQIETQQNKLTELGDEAFGKLKRVGPKTADQRAQYRKI